MAERDLLLVELVKEVLGPRQGANELLSAVEDPRDEYISGVLAPAQARDVPDIDEAAELIEEEGEYEGEDDTVDPSSASLAALPTFSPALDPRSKPHSIGLSFVIRCEEGLPGIEVCATWARYRHPGSSTDWQREPEVFLTGPVRADQDVEWAPGSGVRLRLHARPDDQPLQHRVSLYLVNGTVPRDAWKTATDEFLFQPQIRVRCLPGTSVVPLPGGLTNRTGSSRSAEDDSLALLYRNRRPLARGHLCGAMWQAIDPERPHSAIRPPQGSPFMWADGEALSLEDREKFSSAEVRTELVPCYPVEAPSPDWRSTEFPSEPELDPTNLAELCEPADVRARLAPLVHAYDDWIELRKADLGNLEPDLRTVGERHLAECERARGRLAEAIDLLEQDSEVRLAFCFANRAIAMQSAWSRGGRVIRWRPFQLAFILLNLPAIAIPDHPDRGICDLLWFPTGGGKTEAYLGLAAFTLALRRRRSRRDGDTYPTGAGVAVISRYTLRLLTIQQFRRALGVITACEVLRVQGLGTSALVGWRPAACSIPDNFIWGTARFGAGLWVGGNVTPNGLHSIKFMDQNGKLVDQPGAFDLLSGTFRRMGTPGGPPGEPAQVLACPACRWSDGQRQRATVLAFPDNEALSRGRNQLHLVLTGVHASPALGPQELNLPGVEVAGARLSPMRAQGAATLSIDFDVTIDGFKPEHVDEWWTNRIEPALRAAGCSGVELACARPSRPGYFIRRFLNVQGNLQPCDFELYCPNPDCALNSGEWAEKVPARLTTNSVPTTESEWQDVPEVFRTEGRPDRAGRIPIPAYTVDDQVYHRCPSLVVATVDKFARLSFEPKAASLFGQVDRYHARWGFYRRGAPPSWGGLPPQVRPDPPGLNASTPLHKDAPAFPPPELVLQDELHLIEGPLGSMVGLYETAVDHLAQRWTDGVRAKPKYIASTATVREATNQVQALFDRGLAQFPPPGLDVDDNFFALSQETHALDALRAGRLYVGICGPGRGAQTPIIRIWSALLQSTYERQQAGVPLDEIDPFWTLVGYFNAIRELAGARALYRQDIPERMRDQAVLRGVQQRSLASDSERPLELSSRTDSVRLPGLLEQLTVPLQRGEPEDAVQATSMFGTGVDVDRLGLMVVHGQPKTSAAYIQATGRVGRQTGGLVVAFFRASRPRDLDHYEFFTGYHRALYGYVEPITVAPFSPRARERGLGPMMVALVRSAGHIAGAPVPIDMRVQQNLAAAGVFYSSASSIEPHWNEAAVQQLPDLMEQRALRQPLERRPEIDRTRDEAASWLQRWRLLAQRYPGTADLLYQEPTLVRAPTHPVVLGDPHHHYAGLETAFRNAPQSLRDVEATTRFKG